MLSFVKKVYGILFNVFMVFIVILATGFLGSIGSSLSSDSAAKIILGVLFSILGIILGVFLDIIIGGAFATVMITDRNIEIIKNKDKNMKNVGVLVKTIRNIFVKIFDALLWIIVIALAITFAIIFGVSKVRGVVEINFGGIILGIIQGIIIGLIIDIVFGGFLATLIVTSKNVEAIKKELGLEEEGDSTAQSGGANFTVYE